MNKELKDKIRKICIYYKDGETGCYFNDELFDKIVNLLKDYKKTIIKKSKKQ